MAEGQELEIPENNDDGVVEAMRSLNRQLRTDLMKNYLKEAGDFLYIATNATAKDADQQIKVQSCLFDAVKLCDAWNLMLTSFKVGASDILEKLHIAYLKLLDGFPDFALADVESVTKHVSSMKAACKKAEGSFTAVIKELDGAIRFLKEEERKKGCIRTNHRDEYCDKADQLEKRIIEVMVLNDNLAVVAKDANLKILELELEALRDKYHNVFKTIENCRLAKEALMMAQPKLNNALDFLVKIEQLVDKWYNECKEVVEKNMKANVKQAGKLSEAKQKEYWKPLVFVKTAYNFLCRWKALQQICLSTSTHMRRVRGDIDWYYTENLYPSEAVEKAWALRQKDEELKKKVEPRKQNKVVPDHDRLEALCKLPKLFEMAMAMHGGEHPGGLIKCQKLETVGSYLWYIGLIKQEPKVCMVKERTKAVCSDLLRCADMYKTHSATEFASGFTACKHVLDDVPRRAKGNSVGHDKLKEILRKLSESIRSLNESDLKSAEDHFKTLVADGMKQLNNDIKREECTAVAEEDASTSKFEKVGNLVKKYVPKMLSSQKNSDVVAESIKKYQLALHIIQGIAKQLPLDDINGVYSKMFDNLMMLSSNMREELRVVEGVNGKPPVQEINTGWQDEAICNLIRFVDLFSANSRQVKNVQDLIHIGKINTPTILGKSWTELKQCVGADRSPLYDKALEIDGKVDDEVTDQRRLERHEEQERREKEEQERRRKEREEEKRKESERLRKEKEKQEQKDREQERKKQYPRSSANYGGGGSYASRQTGGAVTRGAEVTSNIKGQLPMTTRPRVPERKSTEVKKKRTGCMTSQSDITYTRGKHKDDNDTKHGRYTNAVPVAKRVPAPYSSSNYSYSGDVTHNREDVRGNMGKHERDKHAKYGQDTITDTAIPELTKKKQASYSYSNDSYSGGVPHSREDVRGKSGKGKGDKYAKSGR